MQAVQNPFSVAAHYPGKFDEGRLEAWTAQLRAQLAAPEVTLGLVFMTPEYFPHARLALEIVQIRARIPLLIGCSSNSLIAGDREIEDSPGLALGLYNLPGAQLRATRFNQKQVEEGSSKDYWPAKTGLNRTQTNGWLVFADPFHLDAESWLRTWNAAYAPLPVVGGLASGDYPGELTQVYHNGEVFEEGGIALSVGGQVELGHVLSQGCTPIGETWTITKSEKNLILQIGNRPAYQVLAETFSHLTPDEQKKARGNLFVGLAASEYHDDFHRGDFLVRNLIGADPQSGVLAVQAFPRTGQTIQFQRRDAMTGTEDICDLLQRTHKKIETQTIYGGCLCSCNGRGHRLFGEANHDAMHVQKEFGPMGLAGFFCNGEIGLVGEKNFLHGYTASLGLFVKKHTEQRSGSGNPM
jgi:small ligand-binding sensory domain FIST